jgi:isoquinoline 1-oxidoreductase
MLYGRIVRPSALDAKLVSSDTTAAEAMPGVKIVRDGDFIGITAPDRETAIRAE